MTEFVIAESGIRQLHARYIDAVWRKDADAFANCFAEHGEPPRARAALYSTKSWVGLPRMFMDTACGEE